MSIKWAYKIVIFENSSTLTINIVLRNGSSRIGDRRLQLLRVRLCILFLSCSAMSLVVDPVTDSYFSSYTSNHLLLKLPQSVFFP
jgi:hypothetical protein